MTEPAISLIQEPSSESTLLACNRRRYLEALAYGLGSVLAAGASLSLTGCATAVGAAAPLRGTMDLGVVIGRENGTITIVDTTLRSKVALVAGLGDLSHASVVFSRDGVYAYVFGRDGGLTQVNLLSARIERRIIQAGNSIGGAISDDGSLVVAQNYQPGGIKIFNTKTLEPIGQVPASYTPALGGEPKLSRVVGLVDLPGRRFAYSLFDADQIWITDCSDPTHIHTEKFENVGHQPYDGLVSPDAHYYIAGIFGEDGLAMIDLWNQPLQVRRILQGYGKNEQKMPVYKMPHLRGWAIAGSKAWLPAVGLHQVLCADTQTWELIKRTRVAGQPIFVIARPDAPQVWVTFAVPDYGQVQVIDTQSAQVAATLRPGKAILHMEFTPRGDAVWISCRDDNCVRVLDTQTFETLAQIDVPSPSGVFMTHRATRVGF